MNANRWTAFTDGELIFVEEAIEASDWDGGLGRNGLDLWESLLDEMDRRPTIHGEMVDLDVSRQRIAAYRTPAPSQSP